MSSDYFLAEKVYIILTFRCSILHSLPEDKIGAFRICSNIDYVYIHWVLKLIERNTEERMFSAHIHRNNHLHNKCVLF